MVTKIDASMFDAQGKEIILDADADTSITADTDNQIDIKIAGADDFQFTANTFTAQSGSTIAAQALTATTGVFSSDVTGLTINATGDTATADNAAIGYTAAEGLILTGQGSTDDITIKNDADNTVINVPTGSADVEISAGDLYFGTAGKGIVLGATTNVDANTLDDYEEGTFTPVFTVGGNNTGITYGTNGQLGRYTKIGRVVICDIYIGLTSKGSNSGNVTFTGFPFTSVAHGLNTSAVANIGSYTGSWNLSSNTHFTGDIGQNSTTLSLREGTYESDANPAAVTAAMAANDSQLYLSITYEAT